MKRLLSFVCIVGRFSLWWPVLERVARDNKDTLLVQQDSQMHTEPRECKYLSRRLIFSLKVKIITFSFRVHRVIHFLM